MRAQRRRLRRSPRRSLRRCSAVVCLLVAGAVLAPQAWSQPLVLALDESVSGEKHLRPAFLRSDDGEATRTAYYARLDAATLGEAIDAAGPSAGIAVEVMPGQHITSRALRRERRSEGGMTWAGTIEEDPFGYIVLTVERGAMSGRLAFDGRIFDVRYGGEGRQVIYEVPPEGGASCGSETGMFQAPPLRPFSLRQEDRPAPTRRSSPSEQGSLSADTVLVMFIYTEETDAKLGVGLKAFVQSMLDITNLHFFNSGVPGYMALSGVYRAPELEGLSTVEALDFLRSADSGLSNKPFYRDLAERRAGAGADIVTLLRESGDYCGIGSIPRPSGGASTGYNVLKRGCSQVLNNFTHELGHNLGLIHDPLVDPGDYPFPYGHGYVDVEASPPFRTVMAYSNACARAGVSCPTVPYFSNPKLSLDGRRLGTEGRSDAARVLRQMIPVAANYFEAPRTSRPIAPDIFLETDEDGALFIVRPPQWQSAGNVVFGPLVTKPKHGAVFSVNDVHFTYTPTQNFSGVDSLVYSVHHERTPSTRIQGTIYIEIHPQPDPPFESWVAWPHVPVSVHPDSGYVEVMLSEMRDPDPLDDPSDLEARWVVSTQGLDVLEMTAGSSRELRVPMTVLDSLLIAQGAEVGAETRFFQRVIVSDGTFETEGVPSVLRLVLAERSEEGNGTVVFHGAYPNPASGTVNIGFGSPDAQAVSVELFDVLGHSVRLVERPAGAGRNEIVLDVAGLAAGTYFYRVELSETENSWRGRVVVL